MGTVTVGSKGKMRLEILFYRDVPLSKGDERSGGFWKTPLLREGGVARSGEVVGAVNYKLRKFVMSTEVETSKARPALARRCISAKLLPTPKGDYTEYEENFIVDFFYVQQHELFIGIIQIKYIHCVWNFIVEIIW